MPKEDNYLIAKTTRVKKLQANTANDNCKLHGCMWQF